MVKSHFFLVPFHRIKATRDGELSIPPRENPRGSFGSGIRTYCRGNLPEDGSAPFLSWELKRIDQSQPSIPDVYLLKSDDKMPRLKLPLHKCIILYYSIDSVMIKIGPSLEEILIYRSQSCPRVKMKDEFLFAKMGRRRWHMSIRAYPRADYE